jgi:hypothetical protein
MALIRDWMETHKGRDGKAVASAKCFVTYFRRHDTYLGGGACRFMALFSWGLARRIRGLYRTGVERRTFF